MITLPVTTFSSPYHQSDRSILHAHLHPSPSSVPTSPPSPPTPSTSSSPTANKRPLSSQATRLRQWSKAKANSVSEIMSGLADASKLSEPVALSAKSPVPVGSNDSVSFEVLYLGKLRMSYRKAPLTFIDDALEKFKAIESERGSKESNEGRRNSSQESASDTKVVAALLKKLEDRDEPDRKAHSHPSLLTATIKQDTSKPDGLIVPKVSFSHPLDDVTYAAGERNRNSSGDGILVKSLSLPVEPVRNRALSTGNEPRDHLLESSKIGSSSRNRTMIFIIGNGEIRIVSPDKKTILFQKNIQDISQTAKGIHNKSCFGFICREIGHSGTMHVGLVFRCESDHVSTEILQVMKQASKFEESEKRGQLYCDHCPMMWFHHLCVDMDGLSDARARQMILKRIDELAEEDRQNILMKFQGAETQNIEEQIELMMMLIRAHCESKQLNHVHDTEQNRHEFLQSYLGSGAILMKVKRTLTTSFDQFMKRKDLQHKGTFPAIGGTSKGFKALLPHHEDVLPEYGKKEMSPNDSVQRPSSAIYSDSPLENGPFRKRSSTLGTIATDNILSELKNSKLPVPSPLILTTDLQKPSTPTRLASAPDSLHQEHSPMMNIFLKVGPGPQQSKILNTPHSHHRKGSWRQAIFKRVSQGGQTSVDQSPVAAFASTTPLSSRKGGYYRPKKSTQEVRDLWRSAIKQQILLNRMEKQNVMLKTKQEEASLKRSKLSYTDMCGSGDDEVGIDILTSKAEKGEPCDLSIFKAVCLSGIPKHRRGHVWQTLVRQFSLRMMGEDGQDPTSSAGLLVRMNCIPSPSCSYEQLLRQLTSHQHAILIDLGRTFPNHAYFSSPLGAGQLALFNLLKAYSLLDPDVGYCQGLSFVAGLLLMHLDEEEAFHILKFFMFEMGGREYYKPDMSGLQLKLYQLNRLMYDHDPDIHLLLYHNDVLPSLYAAPWFLTMFASQFPIGFAVRVMDLAFAQGPDVLVKIALLLILDHKPQLMECSGLEQIMDCFKNVVTNITPFKADNYVRKAFDMRIDRQILVYGIEYSVMHDETSLTHLSDPNYSRLSKLRNEASRGSFDETQERESPTPSSHGSEEEILHDNNNASVILEDIKLLCSYMESLEEKLRLLGEIPVRPIPVTKVLERGTMTSSSKLLPGSSSTTNGIGISLIAEPKTCQP